MAFICPYEPRDASSCANCPIFGDCISQNSDSADEEDDYLNDEDSE